MRERYGMHPLGQNLLLARRLVEAGVGLRHGQRLDRPVAGRRGQRAAQLELGHARRRDGDGKRLRQGFVRHGLVLAAARRGPVGLAGRSPRARPAGANPGGGHRRIWPHPAHQSQGANPGRQHWPSCYTAIIAGGGIRGGVVYGQSDAIGAYVKDKPVRPQDLGATIYHALGVPRDLRLGKDGFTPPSAPASRSKPCSASRCHSQPVRPTLEVNYSGPNGVQNTK